MRISGIILVVLGCIVAIGGILLRGFPELEGDAAYKLGYYVGFYGALLFPGVVLVVLGVFLTQRAQFLSEGGDAKRGNPAGGSTPQATSGTIGQSEATVDIDWITQKLQGSLRRLATDGSQAQASLPDGGQKAEELALDFTHFAHTYLDAMGDAVGAVGRIALLRVDEMLEAMSGRGKEYLWTEDAVREDPRWEDVRSAARKALFALDWRQA